MIDKQKGLVTVIGICLKNLSIGCMWDIFKKKLKTHSCLAFNKQQLWACARATSVTSLWNE